MQATNAYRQSAITAEILSTTYEELPLNPKLYLRDIFNNFPIEETDEESRRKIASIAITVVAVAHYGHRGVLFGSFQDYVDYLASLPSVDDLDDYVEKLPFETRLAALGFEEVVKDSFLKGKTPAEVQKIIDRLTQNPYEQNPSFPKLMQLPPYTDDYTEITD